MTRTLFKSFLLAALATSLLACELGMEGELEGEEDLEIAEDSSELYWSPPPLQLCPSNPDLAVQPLTANNHGTEGWVWVCAPVKNTGGVAWSSASSQVGVRVASSMGGSVSMNGFSTLAVGETIPRCSWVRAPGLLRQGHDTPAYGECQVEMTITASLMLDPDLYGDGNAANDDCLSGNNRRTITIPYMAECPW